MGNSIGLGLLILLFFCAGFLVGFASNTVLERLHILPSICYITEDAANAMKEQ